MNERIKEFYIYNFNAKLIKSELKLAKNLWAGHPYETPSFS